MSMLRYRRSAVDDWRDTRFVAMRDEAKLLSRYMATGPQSNRIGFGVFSPGLAAEDLGWEVERLRERLGEVVETLRWGWDPASRVLFIGDWWAVNRPDNPNVFKKCLDDLRSVPQTLLLERFIAEAETLPQTFVAVLRNVLGNVSVNVAPNHPPQEQEQEQIQEPPPPTPSRQSAVAELDPAWAVVVVELRDAGMTRSRSACDAAKSAGCTPDEVRALLGHFRDHAPAWDFGALHDRIRDAMPGEPPGAHWPPRSKAAALVDASAERRRVAQAAAAQREEAAAARAADVSSGDELERLHGATLDNILGAVGHEVEGLRRIFRMAYGEAAGHRELQRYRHRQAGGQRMARAQRVDLLRVIANPTSEECVA